MNSFQISRGERRLNNAKVIRSLQQKMPTETNGQRKTLRKAYSPQPKDHEKGNLANQKTFK